LNYGYAVLRAAIARALVSAGLLPTLGIHHSNRSNAFCLADDLIEPLRPLVDRRVQELFNEGQLALTPATKARLLELLTLETRFGEECGPLMVNLQRMVASLVRCYEGKSRVLEFPTTIEQGLLWRAPVTESENAECETSSENGECGMSNGE
jgi:CRISPR-associated protein Cas1